MSTPVAASDNATAAPIPRLAPVTKAIFPVSESIFWLCDPDYPIAISVPGTGFGIIFAPPLRPGEPGCPRRHGKEKVSLRLPQRIDRRHRLASLEGRPRGPVLHQRSKGGRHCRRLRGEIGKPRKGSRM